MPSETIDLFNPARTPYQDSDMFGIGYGPAPTPTYRGTLTDLVAYLYTKAGTGQITPVGNVNFSMRVTDFELVTQVGLTFSPTWTLPQASLIAAGQRRRIVDLAGVVGTFAIAVAPAGSDRINGSNTAVLLNKRWSYLVLESDGAINWTIVEQGLSLLAANNLGDLSSAAAARANLGLGSAATQNVATFLLPPNNLSDLVNPATARSNLGLGTLAILAAVAFGNLDPSAIATLQQLLNATSQKLITSDILWSSQIPVAMAGTGNVTWDFNTFINGIFTLSSNSSITVANPKPGQSGFIIIKNTSPAKTLTWPASGIFNWITTTNTIYTVANSVNMFEYWVESASLIRTRLTQNI